MANKFLAQLEKKSEAPADSSEKSSNKFLAQIQKRPEQSEGLLRGAARTAVQIPLGAAKAHPLSYGADIFKLATDAASQNVLAELSESNPDFNRQIAEQGRQQSMEYLPTQELAERLIEKHTGTPLTPKNALQKAIRLGSTAASFRPGGAGAKGTAAVVAPAVKGGLEAAGVPEGVSEIAGLVASGLAPSPSAARITKPSGLTTRRFEKIGKETKVSPGRAEAIKESVEKDFGKISNQILEKNRTYSALKEDSLFKEKIGDLFGDVEKLAEGIEGEIHTDDLRKAFQKRYNSRETKGISPDEFERSFRKEIRTINKGIPVDDLNAPQLVEQFRKNNRSLKELFEPGKSSAHNRARREALLEYNRAIEDVIKKEYPDTEFGDLFEFTNKRWSEISDIEQIEKFNKDLFDGKINYSKAKQLFQRDKEHVARPFKRILGEEGFNDFKQLTEDLLSTEKSMSYIKKSREAGFGDLATTAGLYLISPKAGAVKTIGTFGKKAYQMMLDKPQIAVEWKSAFDNLKTGHYKEAEKGFKNLNKSIGE